MSEKKIDNVSPKNIYNTDFDKFVTREGLLGEQALYPNRIRLNGYKAGLLRGY
jgi:hypothetical protein